MNALAASGADVIHMATCMVQICPFVAKYEKAILAENPNLTVVRGTHPEAPQAIMEQMREHMLEQLTAPGRTVPEIARDVRAAQDGSPTA